MLLCSVAFGGIDRGHEPTVPVSVFEQAFVGFADQKVFGAYRGSLVVDAVQGRHLAKQLTKVGVMAHWNWQIVRTPRKPMRSAGAAAAGSANLRFEFEKEILFDAFSMQLPSGGEPGGTTAQNRDVNGSSPCRSPSRIAKRAVAKRMAGLSIGAEQGARHPAQILGGRRLPA